MFDTFANFMLTSILCTQFMLVVYKPLAQFIMWVFHYVTVIQDMAVFLGLYSTPLLVLIIFVLIGGIEDYRRDLKKNEDELERLKQQQSDLNQMLLSMRDTYEGLLAHQHEVNNDLRAALDANQARLAIAMT